MKTVGLIGGMSWESTALYYQRLNEAIKEQCGGLHSAKVLLYSVDFAEIEHYQVSGEWETCGKILGSIAQNLEHGGADFILLCTNTMHKVVPQMKEHISIPVIHIADATAEVLLQKGIRKVGLLGTKYTMTEDFYRDRIASNGIHVVTPCEQDMDIVHSVIFEELCLGTVSISSRKEFQRIVNHLKEEGAEGVILGCTEICMLLQQEHVSLPLFDTTEIHANKAASLLLE